MRLHHRDEGFTLIELMVVVLIIGILVAIAIPVFNAAKYNAQQKACFANQRTIDGAVQTYMADGSVSGSAPTTPTVADTTSPLVPTYIAKTPECPGDPANPANPYTIDGAGLTEGCPAESVTSHGTYQ